MIPTNVNLILSSIIVESTMIYFYDGYKSELGFKMSKRSSVRGIAYSASGPLNVLDALFTTYCYKQS
jgi:hypothetical protein